MKRTLSMLAGTVLAVGMLPGAATAVAPTACCGPTPPPPECQSYIDGGDSIAAYLRGERDQLQEQVWNQQATIEGLRDLNQIRKAEIRRLRAEVRRLRAQN